MPEVPHVDLMLLGPTADVVSEGIGRALLRENEERAVLGGEGVVSAQLEEELLRLNVPHLCEKKNM